MKKLLIAIICLFVVTSISAQHRLRFGSVIPSDSPWEQGLIEYIDFVEEKSGGSISIKTYLGGQLGGEVEMINSIAMGTLHGGAFSVAAIAEALSIPQLQVFELPFLFNNDSEADYIMDEVMFEPMAGLLEKKGLVLILWGTNGWRCFGSSDKAIKTPEDLKGLKMRSQESEVYVNLYKTLNATPVPLATPDVLVSLKTGMVDGFDQTPIFSLSTGWVTAVKYYTLSNHIYQPGAIVFSKRYFDRMSESEKNIILAKGIQDELTKNSRTYVREAGDEILEIIMEDSKINVLELNDSQRTAFIAATKGVYTKMEGRIGKDILDRVQSELKAYRETHQ